MITLFTGSPGAGKTASLVDYLSKLPGDRPIYVDGLNGLTLEHTPCDATKWHEELPDGAILVIDEVQRVWRPRAPGAKVSQAVAELETHRHRGIDVFLTTQSPKLLDSNVRALVGRHVHIRDTGILGRYWYEWPECNEAMAWKTCVNKKRITLPTKAFDLYKSASIHTKPVRGVPRALIVGIVALLVFFLLAYAVYEVIKRTQEPQAPTGAPPLSTPTVFNQDQGEQAFIDDRVAFIPRVSNKPESAPAYDHLRNIVAMPVVVGGVCMGEKCKCYTAQATDAGLTAAECRTWLANPPFDPYKLPPAPQGLAPAEATAAPSLPDKQPAVPAPTPV